VNHPAMLLVGALGTTFGRLLIAHGDQAADLARTKTVGVSAPSPGRRGVDGNTEVLDAGNALLDGHAIA
jgi:hypothetical protein